MANVSNPFGGSYVEDKHSNITSRYTFDNGQKTSFYDVSKIKLKPGKAAPTHPIKISFDHFTHSNAGDYFDVTSYATIPYSDIPTVTLGDTTFKLRDCIDFRPRINDAGTGFTGTGTPTNQPLFLDPEVDFTLSFRHYLGKVTTIGIDDNGELIFVDGVSSNNPVEPDFPGDNLKLFVLDQKPFVFDIKEDITIKRIESKRFTMKEIGKLENRIKTLEFYTTLNFLERDAQQSQIQDSLGFERFKNGFLVDSFTGHGVGDSVENPDYSTSINFKDRTAQPLVKNQSILFKELSVTDSARTSNNYVRTGDVLTLPYNESVFLQNPFSSTTENLNPFNIGIYQGLLKLNPPGDIFFEDKRVPDQTVDVLGTYDSLKKQSLVKKDGQNIFGSINDIEQFRQGTKVDTDELPEALKSLSDVVGALNPTTSTVEVSSNEVVRNTTVIPKMKNVVINFTSTGMRPNTRLFAFFDDLEVSPFITPKTTAIITASAAVDANANVQNMATLANAVIDASNVDLSTNSTGVVSGTFNYVTDTLNLDVGKKTFRLTSSSTNDSDNEVTFSESIFFSDGIVREIFKEVLRPRVVHQPDNSGSTASTSRDPSPEPATNDYVDQMYLAVFGRLSDPTGRADFSSKFPALNKKVTDTLTEAETNEIKEATNLIVRMGVDSVTAGIEPQVDDGDNNSIMSSYSKSFMNTPNRGLPLEGDTVTSGLSFAQSAARLSVFRKG